MSLDIAITEAIYRQHRDGQGAVRTGQAIMNALHEVSPSLASLVPTEVDPFYDDSLIPAFWDWFYSEIEEGYQ